MKKLKPLFLSAMLLLLVCLIGTNVQAAGITTYDDTNQYYFTTNQKTEESMYGVTWNKVAGTTSIGDQSVNLFTMKTDGVNSKLVVWSAHYQNFRNNRTTLSVLAANYEKKHPGWKVVAGINADQYAQKFGTELHNGGGDYYPWQPYYPIIMDGERRFPYTVTGCYYNAIGFTNDGSPNGFVDVNNVEGLYLEILDADGNILSKHPVENINSAPGSNQTAVWFSYINSRNEYEALNVTSDNNLYIVSNAEFAYMSNSRTYTYKGHWAVDNVFGRGTIDQMANNFTLTKGQFVIDSNNSALKELLNTGVRVRVQFYYTNDVLNNVEAASGYHSVQRLNGVDANVSGSYNTNPYPRSVFGIKADGTYVLMTSDMGGTIRGLNGWEINAFLKQNGVVTAYQDDGGGSVTAVWRNKDGGFDVVNVPRDGGERANLTGLFFVVKDSGITVDSVDATANSLTLNINTDAADMTKIQKINCTLNGVTKEVINNKVTFEGLDKLTEYAYSFSYDTKDETNVDAMLNGVATTAKTMPTITDLKIEVKDEKVIFTPIIEDPDLAFEYIRIVIGDERYPYLDEPIEIEIEAGLKKLEYTLTYSYDLKDGKDKVIVSEDKVLVLEEDDPSNEPGNEPNDDPSTDPTPEPSDPVETQPGKGCKDDASLLVISLISLSSALVLVRKRKS